MLNALIMEMTTTKQQLSLRSVASIFDRKADYLKMLTTSLLAINMPMVLREYGTYKQMDLVATIDSDTFHNKKQDSASNGFTIDEKGRITGTLNMVSYLKVAPDEALSYPPGSSETQRSKQKQKMNRGQENGEDSDSEESEEEVGGSNHDEWVRNITNSEDWLIARTIYSSLQLKGRIAVEKLDENVSELVVQIEKVDFSKLDFHKGKPDEQLDASKVKDESEEDEEDSDSDVSDPTKTAEGGLI